MKFVRTGKFVVDLHQIISFLMKVYYQGKGDHKSW